VSICPNKGPQSDLGTPILPGPPSGVRGTLPPVLWTKGGTSQ